MKIIQILFFLIFFLSSSSQAQEWVEIASTENRTFDILVGSIEEYISNAGMQAIASVGRVIEKDTQKISLFRWFVPLKHCAEKKGKLIITDLEGSVISYGDFEFGSGTVSSVISGLLCDIASKKSRSKIEKLTII